MTCLNFFIRNETQANNPHNASWYIQISFRHLIYLFRFLTRRLFINILKTKVLKSTKNYRFGIANVYTTRTYEMPTASTQENIDFKSVNKQFDWLELKFNAY